MKTTVRVWVPGTTANVGPGFDALGIALEIYNTVDLEISNAPGIILGRGTPPDSNSVQMIRAAAQSFFMKTESEERGLKVQIRGDVPAARGLGSSVTVRLGVVAGLNRIFGKPLRKHQVLELVAALEGHPDNAASAIYGGFAVSGIVGDRVACFHKSLPRTLKFVAAIPDFEVETKKARDLLPVSVPMRDAVHNLNRSSLLVAAFWSGDYEAVGDFLEDRLHQNPRSALIPQLFPCLEAARLAGAIGGWLSGSGSTVMALTLSHPSRVAAAMKKVFEESGRSCRVVVAGADPRGARFED